MNSHILSIMLDSTIVSRNGSMTIDCLSIRPTLVVFHLGVTENRAKRVHDKKASCFCLGLLSLP